jgi:hypothetical protein
MNRPKLLLPRRRPRAHGTLSVAVPADAPQLEEVTQETSPSTTPSHPPTRSRWTTSDDSRQREAARPARTPLLARAPCSTPEATAVDDLPQVALLVAVARTLAHLPALAHHPPGIQWPTQMHLGKLSLNNRVSCASANLGCSLLADTGENPGSPPSTAASPALSKAALDSVVSGDDKKE